MEEVRPNSWTETFSANLSNSLSGAVSGSSRYSGGCASNAERRLKDMLEGRLERGRGITGRTDGRGYIVVASIRFA